MPSQVLLHILCGSVRDHQCQIKKPWQNIWLFRKKYLSLYPIERRDSMHKFKFFLLGVAISCSCPIVNAQSWLINELKNAGKTLDILRTIELPRLTESLLIAQLNATKSGAGILPNNDFTSNVGLPCSYSVVNAQSGSWLNPVKAELPRRTKMVVKAATMNGAGSLSNNGSTSNVRLVRRDGTVFVIDIRSGVILIRSHRFPTIRELRKLIDSQSPLQNRVAPSISVPIEIDVKKEWINEKLREENVHKVRPTFPLNFRIQSHPNLVEPEVMKPISAPNIDNKRRMEFIREKKVEQMIQQKSIENLEKIFQLIPVRHNIKQERDRNTSYIFYSAYGNELAA